MLRNVVEKPTNLLTLIKAGGSDSKYVNVLYISTPILYFYGKAYFPIYSVNWFKEGKN